MNEFKLLLFLPFLAFKKVVESMELIEVFELSQVSNRMFLKIKCVRRRILPIQIFKGDVVQRISVTDKEGAGSVRQFELNFKFKPVSTSIERQLKLNNDVLKVWKKVENEGKFIIDSTQFHQAIVSILTCLLEIFRCPGHTIFIRVPQVANILPIITHPIFLKCTYIRVFGNPGEVLENKNMDALLEHTKPTFGITIDCDIDAQFNQKNVLDLPRFHTKFGDWITFDDLINMDLKTACLDNHTFKETDINNFVKLWLTGKFPKLMRLRLGGFETEPDWDVLLEGVSNSNWDEKRRERYYISKYTYDTWKLDCKNGWDFERSDGILATILHNRNFLDFCVWHNRFPSTMSRPYYTSQGVR